MAYSSTTNLSLRKTTKTAIGYQDDENFHTDSNSNSDVLEKAIAGIATAPTGASIPNLNGCRILELNPRVSKCSIASIAGTIKGVPFTIISKANSSTAFVDDKALWKLSATWVARANYSITLVWNGTNLVELGRSNN